MKFAIIGAGNMGSALARGLAGSGYDVAVSNPSMGKLSALRAEFGSVSVTTSNSDAIRDADYIILAVKPWIIPSVIDELAGEIDYNRQTIVSLASGVTIDDIANMLSFNTDKAMIARVMPNIAISYGLSMTFVAYNNTTLPVARNGLEKALGEVGSVAVIDERKFSAAMALCSCGIAYALRYIRASVEGAVALGLSPDDASVWVSKTLMGAAACVMEGNHPEVAIDRVTTPGGTTIRGLNAMEANGFSHAVIEGLMQSAK